MSEQVSITKAIYRIAGLLWGTKSTDSTVAESVDVTSGALHVAARDSSGAALSPTNPNPVVETDAGSRTYTYNADGTLATVAWTLNGVTRTKTYTYSSGRISAISDWV
jgi:YD repeat-containing protein